MKVSHLNPHTRPAGARLVALALSALVVVAAAADALGQRREHELLGRLLQTPGASQPALQVFREGRDLIGEEKWARAAEIFNRFINEYPKDRNADAAYYYLALAYKKQNRITEAQAALAQLISRYPRSQWVDDAEVMQAEIDPAKARELKDKADVDLKIIALQSLCQSDPAQCPTYVGEVLNSGSRSSQRLREAAVRLLGRHGGQQAIPVLTSLARNEADEKIRVQAIAALGQTNQDSVLDTLRELAMGPEFKDNNVVDMALHALVENDSPRAVQILGDLTRTARTVEARRHAIYLLATRRKGEDVVDQLFRTYDTDQSLEIRKQVIEGLGSRMSQRAHDRLVEIARAAPNVELRKLAIRTIPARTRAVNRDPNLDLDLFISLYDSERDEELKDSLLEAIARYDTNKRALQKVMQVVRGNEPLERRKRAISWLSRSKDPEVKKFLEDMLR
ncbi:MAG TPA: HEAT repeat domain-containing protein [Pyrinomonadaceae bacterium]|nr:HEAT repeat domain-containing protein [Pyrinomonadaceae bacterium]